MKIWDFKPTKKETCMPGACVVYRIWHDQLISGGGVLLSGQT